MNLHGIVKGAIASVNPMTQVVVFASTGSVTGADGTPVPTYAPGVTAMAQLQDLSHSMLVQLAGLNLQGNLRYAYLDGNWDGIIRAQGVGGDKVTIGDQTWLVVQVVEMWPDWCKLLLNRQVNP